MGQIGINVPVPVPLPFFSWSSSKGSILGVCLCVFLSLSLSLSLSVSLDTDTDTDTHTHTPIQRGPFSETTAFLLTAGRFCSVIADTSVTNATPLLLMATCHNSAGDAIADPSALLRVQPREAPLLLMGMVRSRHYMFTTQATAPTSTRTLSLTCSW